MTIGVPGNVPYVITVGAMTDAVSPADPSDDTLASFSSAGPTVEGFVKPDLVAPGGHMLSLMEKTDTLPLLYPEFHDGNIYFTMSGTSQAAGVVDNLPPEQAASPRNRSAVRQGVRFCWVREFTRRRLRARIRRR